ncbi:hypothetical protein VCHA53O466_50043 [Vibrio chagasii]|nr:hypothetical protein VCHA53O466_50043 [Vibrio chagasii]
MDTTEEHSKLNIPPIHLLNSFADGNDSICKGVVRDFKLSIGLELSNSHTSVIHAKEEIRSLSNLSNILKCICIASGVLLIASLSVMAVDLFRGGIPNLYNFLGLIISGGILTFASTAHFDFKSEASLHNSRLSSLDSIITQHQKRIELCDKILCEKKVDRVYL